MSCCKPGGIRRKAVWRKPETLFEEIGSLCAGADLLYGTRMGGGGRSGSSKEIVGMADFEKARKALRKT